MHYLPVFVQNWYHVFFWPNLWSVTLDNKACLMDRGAMRSLGVYPMNSYGKFGIGVYFVCIFDYCNCCVPFVYCMQIFWTKYVSWAVVSCPKNTHCYFYFLCLCDFWSGWLQLYRSTLDFIQLMETSPLVSESVTIRNDRGWGRHEEKWNRKWISIGGRTLAFWSQFCPAVGLSLVEYIRRLWCSLV